MKCPKCRGDVRVVDTASNAKIVIRRRRCLDCDYVFHTSENIIDSTLGAPLIEKFKSNNRIDL